MRIGVLLITIAQATARTVLDLSYQYGLDVEALVKEYQEISDETVLVDVSNSNLGDASFQKAFSKILKDHTATVPTRRRLDLKAQMNQLSSQSAAFLLTTLLNRTLVATETDSTPSRVHSLDIGWNSLLDDREQDAKQKSKAFHKALEQLIASEACPTTLCLECTNIGPATCRAIAKGLIARFEGNKQLSLLSLKMANNDIGDSGLAALAAAIRTICCSDEAAHPQTILNTLDLSACDIGDAGIDTLALTLEEASPENEKVIIRNLILSNNHISDDGAVNIGRFFRSKDPLFLDLSNNKITDRGLSTIADGIERGLLSDISLRSCHIHADGAEQIGAALRKFYFNPTPKKQSVTLDLSGNPIGLLRGKAKSEGSKYSASKLKSTATATASAYMNQGLSFLKKGLETAGLSSTAESDDEEEKEGNVASEQQGDESSKKRCGFKSMANAFIGNEESPLKSSSERLIFLSLRRTFCDTSGSEALAAMMVAAEDDMAGLSLSLDLELNPVLEESTVAALTGKDDDLLREMADRHIEAMEIIRRASERAREAARLASIRLESKRSFDRRDEVYDEWVDSDAVYDDEAEDDY